MSDVQAAKYVSRNTNTDYSDTPDWYNRDFRNGLAPFITFTHKNINDMGKLLYDAGRFWKKGSWRAWRGIGIILGPILGAYYINHKYFEDEYNILGASGWSANPYMVILHKDDTDGDGKADHVWLWSPRMPATEAMELMSLDRLMPTIKLIQLGVLSPKQGAQRILDDIIGFRGPKRVALKLANPLIQAAEGLRTNIDPYSHDYVIPPEVLATGSSASKAAYQLSYILQKILPAMGTYARSTRPEGSKQPLTAWGINTDGLPDVPILKPIARQILSALSNGPLDFSRAAGFYRVDLREVQLGNIQRIIYEGKEKSRAWKRKVIKEFESSTLSPEEFREEIINDLSRRKNDGTYDMGPAATHIDDAWRRDRIELFSTLYGGAKDNESLMYSLYAPSTWVNKIDRVLYEGKDPLTKKPLTNKERELWKNRLINIAALASENDLTKLDKPARERVYQQLYNLLDINEPLSPEEEPEQEGRPGTLIK